MKALSLETWFEPRRLKSGEDGALMEQRAWYSPIRKCEMCGRLGAPKRIQYRPLCYHAEKRQFPMYCMGCWNKVRRFVEIEKLIDFANYASRKIVREARKHGNEKR